MAPHNNHSGITAFHIADLFMDIARAQANGTIPPAIAKSRLKAIMQLAVNAGFTDRDVIPELARMR